MHLKRIVLVLIAGMIAVLGGCGGSKSSSGGGGGGGNPTITAIVVTPDGAAITTTGSTNTITYKAQATYSDGSQKDISSSASWSAAPSGIVNLSGSTATAAAVGAVTITASSASKSGSVALNVTDLSLGNSKLTGSYAFSLQGIDSVGPVYAAGVFTSDGKGNITGTIDLNSAKNGVQASNATFTGTYSIAPDGRGTMTVSGTGIGTGVLLRLVISKDGTKGKLIRYDGMAAIAGTFEAQTAGALSGTYTFRLGGVELNSPPTVMNCVGKPACYMGEVGVLTVPSSGTALTGVADANLTNGNNYSSNGFAGTINAPTSSRGTMTIALRNGNSVDLVYYVVSPSKFYMVGTDAGAGLVDLLAGQAETQGTLAAFSGDYTFLLDHAATPSTGTFEKTGRMTLAGGSAPTGSESEDLSTSAVQDQSFAFSGGTYTDPTAGPQGQGTISALVAATPSAPNRNFVYYAVDSTKAYMMQTTANCGGPPSTCDGGAFRAAIGELEGGGSVALPVKGDFIFSSVELGELSIGGQNLQIGQLISDGAGNLSGIVDAIKHAGGSDVTISSVAVSSTQLDGVPSSLCPSNSCLFEYGFTPSNVQALAVKNYLVYVRPDGNRAVLLGYQPDIDGYIDIQ